MGNGALCGKPVFPGPGHEEYCAQHKSMNAFRCEDIMGVERCRGIVERGTRFCAFHARQKEAAAARAAAVAEERAQAERARLFPLHHLVSSDDVANGVVPAELTAVTVPTGSSAFSRLRRPRP